MSIKKIIFALVLALNATLVFAADECPSVDFVREKAHFTSAHTFMEKYYWVLTTDNFQLNGKKWNIMFITRLMETDATKALSAGQKFYDSQVKVSTPQIERDGDQLFCIYAQDDHYGLSAVSPPTIYFDE